MIRGTKIFFQILQKQDVCRIYTQNHENRIELELKVGYNGSHATALDLDISIDKCKFLY